MNNDRELLERAAKATGMNHLIPQIDFHAKPVFGCWWNINTDEEVWWNPLTNDGDALRLAVKLNLIVNCIHAKILVEEPVCSRVEIWEELQNDDPYAATRRAIVRAAAEIGKEQK